MSGDLLAEADRPEPVRRRAKPTARLSIAASMPPMLRQCATTDITAVRAASIRFAMAAMLGRLVAQIKMPRLDAYA